MTAQSSDFIEYKGDKYSIAGISGNRLFDPTQYGMEPVSWCTACWSGYSPKYRIENDVLCLVGLKVCLSEPVDLRPDKRVPAPVIESYTAIDVSDEENSYFEYRYEDIHLRLPFSGGLLLADDFIEELYVHMGYHPAWKYRTVYELQFAEGHLTRSDNVSEKMKQVRLRMKGSGSGSNFETFPKDDFDWIRECFLRDYYS